MKGHLIVLEGIDGCGKSTQIRHLANWLPISGLMPPGAKLHTTREPGGTSLGQALRHLLLNPPGEQSPNPITELLLYAADRAQHITQFIYPKLQKGDWIISDRFSGSTLAYQGYGRQLDLQIIRQLETIATQGLVADLTFFMDISVRESLARRRIKPKDRIEAEGEIFLNQVATGFARISKEKQWVKINANLDIALVSKELEEKMKDFCHSREVESQ